MDSPTLSDINEAAHFLSSRMKERPTIGMITGTGLDFLCALMKNEHSFPCIEIPHFPSIGKTERRILSGTFKGHSIVILNRRLHVYEGFSMSQIAFVVRLFKELGVNILIVTNAAGGLNPSYTPGQMMLITDHINLMGGSPLTGPNMDALGPRFPDMSAPYDPVLIELMNGIALKRGILLCKGVYVAVPGPNLETRAETRFLRNIGADAVGMSTVPEVIAAVHCGMKILGISVISNINLPDNPKAHTLEEIVEVVRQASPVLKTLMDGFFHALPEEISGAS